MNCLHTLKTQNAMGLTYCVACLATFHPKTSIVAPYNQRVTIDFIEGWKSVVREAVMVEFVDGWLHIRTVHATTSYPGAVIRSVMTEKLSGH